MFTEKRFSKKELEVIRVLATLANERSPPAGLARGKPAPREGRGEGRVVRTGPGP